MSEAPKKARAKKPAAKKAAAAKPEAMPATKKAAKAPKPAKTPAKKAAKKTRATSPAESSEDPPSAAKRAPPEGPVEKTRVSWPRELYDAHKDEIKAPFKAHGLKWQYLGEGKGRYHAEGVNVFAVFTEHGTDYSLWGADKATVEAIMSAWRALVGDARYAELLKGGERSVAREEAKAESEALKLWKLQEPQRRPGEPDFFFTKRREEWLAKKPGD